MLLISAASETMLLFTEKVQLALHCSKLGAIMSVYVSLFSFKTSYRHQRDNNIVFLYITSNYSNIHIYKIVLPEHLNVLKLPVELEPLLDENLMKTF
jgi:hypothetical protein